MEAQKKLRLRESKCEAFMKKHGWKDKYEMRDNLLAEGYEVTIVPDGTFKERMANVWWWTKKVLSRIVAVCYAPIYLIAWLLFALFSILSGIMLFLMLDPQKAAKRICFPFNANRQK